MRMLELLCATRYKAQQTTGISIEKSSQKYSTQYERLGKSEDQLSLGGTQEIETESGREVNRIRDMMRINKLRKSVLWGAAISNLVRLVKAF